jgi:hypothetical protein
MKDWLKRYQEMTGWLPLLAVLAVVGWVVFGASAGRDDLIRWLLELPILTGYALAAAGMAYLAWRRWSIRLKEAEVCDYWERLMRGERGALVVYVVNAAFYLIAFLALLWFFWQPR